MRRKRIITCVQKEEVKCPFNGDSNGSDLLKARGEIAIWNRTFCPLLIMTAVLLSDSHLSTGFSLSLPLSVYIYIYICIVHHPLDQAKFSGAKQWRASSGSYPRGFAREEELVETRCSLRLSETSFRPAMTILERTRTSILHTNNRSRRYRLLSASAEACALPNSSISI